jgi:trans-2,3-dihydro-3-hydroxyanthranilate isomerase
MDLDFVLADVFSDHPFMGNQLAVIPNAEGLSDATMQAITREFNFSETTFVLPPENPKHTCRLRIFAPRNELPFAGHPTLGTAAVLARREGANASLELVRSRLTWMATTLACGCSHPTTRPQRGPRQ